MTYSVQALTFKEPTEAEVKLTPTLAATIHDLNKKRREQFFHLCVIAYGLRRRNLEKAKGDRRGGNAKGEKYKKAFQDWYAKNQIEEAYGTLPNFTLYAMAGRLLTYIRWQVGAQYIDRLPMSLTALYELSKVLSEKGSKVTPQSKKSLTQLLHKKISDGNRKASYFINPHVSRAAIDAFLSASQKSKQLKNVSSPAGLPLCTIYVNRALLDGFTKTTHARKRGSVDISHVQQLQEAIVSLIKKYNQKSDWFWANDNLLSLQEKTAAKTDFGKFI